MEVTCFSRSASTQTKIHFLPLSWKHSEICFMPHLSSRIRQNGKGCLTLSRRDTAGKGWSSREGLAVLPGSGRPGKKIQFATETFKSQLIFQLKFKNFHQFRYEYEMLLPPYRPRYRIGIIPAVFIHKFEQQRGPPYRPLPPAHVLHGFSGETI